MASQAPKAELTFYTLSPPANQVALGTRVCVSGTGWEVTALPQTQSRPQIVPVRHHWGSPSTTQRRNTQRKSHQARRCETQGGFLILLLYAGVASDGPFILGILICKWWSRRCFLDTTCWWWFWQEYFGYVILNKLELIESFPFQCITDNLLYRIMDLGVGWKPVRILLVQLTMVSAMLGKRLNTLSWYSCCIRQRWGLYKTMITQGLHNALDPQRAQLSRTV